MCWTLTRKGEVYVKSSVATRPAATATILKDPALPFLITAQ